jgi:RNA polymerase sigma-70 factor (ECF subfamily)
MRHSAISGVPRSEAETGTEADAAERELQALVALAQGGDQDAFGRMYVSCQGPIRGFLLRRTSDPDVAEDLAQQVFVRAWQALPRYQQTGVPFMAWLFRIARNALIDHYRRERPTVGIEDFDLPSESDHDAALIHAEEFEAVARAMKRLRADYQDVIRLRFLMGLSSREVAEVMERSEGAIRVLQLRAIRALRAELNVVEEAA